MRLQHSETGETVDVRDDLVSVYETQGWRALPDDKASAAPVDVNPNRKEK